MTAVAHHITNCVRRDIVREPEEGSVAYLTNQQISADNPDEPPMS